jgi:hypothetical protein
VPRRLAAAVGAGVVLGAAGLLPPTPASAAAACADSSIGVTVVVDFSYFGGGIQTSCVPGDPGTGLNALQRLYSTQGTQQFGNAYVCRINGLPTPDTEACVVTPPSNAYWSYWHGVNGSWRYSTIGAAGYDVGVGAVEGWSFGAGSPPGMGAPIPPAPPPAPPPPPPPPPPATQPTSGSGAAAGTSSIPAESASATGPSNAATRAPSTTTSGPNATPSASTVDSQGSGGLGPGIGTIAGITLVAGLAAVAVTIAARRRRQAAGVPGPSAETDPTRSG